MEAYVDEVRKMEERFDGLQTEDVPRVKNIIADNLSKRAALKLPVEPGTFVLLLTQPTVAPSARPDKIRKLNSRQYFPAQLPKAVGNNLAGGEVDGDNAKPIEGQETPTEPQVLAVETNAPAVEDIPLVLVVEPQASAWVQNIVQFLQTRDLPEEQEEAEKLARQSSMYQFVDNILCRRRPNGVKLKCIPQEDGLKLLTEIHGGICGSHIGSRALVVKAFWQGFYWPTTLRLQHH
ncbi:hypothetical protein ZWY2020_052262 [Hordeum vulgare]|nr:hypothetical protein ZWY2020_052262 [Hordeum vulgare]